MRITRLGEGVDAHRRLSPAAMSRTVQVLGEFRGRMDALGVSRGRLVATSAVRDASNRDEFLTAASEATGLRAELLTGDEEGRTAYAGATLDLPAVDVDTVVVDIGGGSTELVIGRSSQLRVASLELGCVRITERYLRHDPPTVVEVEGAMRVIDEVLDAASSDGLALGAVSADCRLIGLAGTVSTLAALEQRLDEYDRAKIQHFVLTSEQVAYWCDALAGETSAARGQRPGMDPGRKDVIVGGALVLRQVMRRLAARTCLVSESDILDGLAASIRGDVTGNPVPGRRLS